MSAVEIGERVVFSDAEKTVREWTVRVGRFVAVVPECPCGRYADTGKPVATVPIAECLCRSEACRSNQVKRNVCHGWHRARVERLAESVRKLTRSAVAA